MRNIKHEIWSGIFIILALFAGTFICFKITNFNLNKNYNTYRIYAKFNNIGNLKINSPINIGGVVIGRVSNIYLEKGTYLPVVAMDIEKQYNNIPNTSSLSIKTFGLLGEKYIELNVGFEDKEMETFFLKNGDIIQDAKSALSLEDIISYFIYNKQH